MIGFLKNLAIVANTGILGALFFAGSGHAQMLNARCIERQNDMYTLKFDGQSILSRVGPERIPLKRMLIDLCQLRQGELENIDAVTVVGRSLDRSPAAVWLEGDNYRSQLQYLDARPFPNNAAHDQVQFQLRQASYGRLQVLIQGDTELEAIKVKIGNRFNPNYPEANLMVYRVTCESNDFAPGSCYVPGLQTARLVKRLSNASCIPGYSYFIRNDRINVTRGCRAEFEVTAIRMQPR